MRSAAFLGASLAVGPPLAAAQDQPASKAFQHQQLAEKKGDEAETKSEFLARCNSVIRSPEVGDREIVEPAPPVGRTPVIKPKQRR